MKFIVIYFVLLVGLYVNGDDSNFDEDDHRTGLFRPRIARSACPNENHCRSKWGYCGTGLDYCGAGCRGGGSIGQINAHNFACVFRDLDAGTRNQRFRGLQATGWKAANAEEAAIFLAHVYHETHGLRTIREYCAPDCGHAYQGGPSSWCKTTGPPGKLYYGRAGKALGVDLLSNLDLVETDSKLAVSTALWFYRTQGMAEPARRGDFAATTRIINGPLECNGGSGYSHQLGRVKNI
ncbi:unnamed protein product [Adineta ricciae]|uniref:Chitin-binding type-1 domain-containing protein n=1 Tax=Adineta ricciae TaxID=249248 RepID=A0A815SX73_ADIRI|nr:unnamed protein product [Adineta ricciae]